MGSSTEEFELGLEILQRRNAHRTVRRTQEYLLVGLLYHKQPNGKLTRLTGSTSNASRPGGGTPYYRHARAGGISFSCSALDNAVAKEIARIQVNPELISTIESAFTRDLDANLS